jgi:hypothetical protein
MLSREETAVQAPGTIWFLRTPKSFDLDLHHVTGLQKYRRLSKHTHTIGRAGRDDVAEL